MRRMEEILCDHESVRRSCVTEIRSRVKRLGIQEVEESAQQLGTRVSLDFCY